MRYFILILLFAFTINAQAQPARKKYFAAGIDAGVSNYMGDLDGDFNLRFLRPAYGIHALYLFSDRLNLRLAAFRGTITADDYYQSKTVFRNRNLNFFSPITEVSLSLILKPFRKKGNEFSRHLITPYFFGGIAVFKFRPQTTYAGGTVDLQALGTEGQRLGAPYPLPYSLTQISFPIGMGFLYRLNYRWDLGIETGFRKTFTDYLDDVSGAYPDSSQMATANPLAQMMSDRHFPPGSKRGALRGNSQANDWYIYTNVSLTYYFYISKKGQNGSNNCIRVRM